MRPEGILGFLITGLSHVIQTLTSSSKSDKLVFFGTYKTKEKVLIWTIKSEP